MPTPMAMPPREIMLMLTPHIFIKINEAIMQNGIEVAMMMVFRKDPRKNKITSVATMPPNKALTIRFEIALLINVDGLIIVL